MHADIHNDAYWPRGEQTAEEWLASFGASDFDVVIAKSLFTHMLPVELNVYLPELARRLTPDGRGLLTFFLLNEENSNAQGQPDIEFVEPAPGSVYAVKRLAAPTASVAYKPAYLLKCLDDAGLRPVGDRHRGSWSGCRNALSYQDILIVARK